MTEKAFHIVVDGRLWNTPALLGEHLLKLERGVCILEEPGRSFAVIKPKRLVRVDSIRLTIDTGFWKYGRLRLKFDSSFEADVAERELRGMLPR